MLFRLLFRFLLLEIVLTLNLYSYSLTALKPIVDLRNTQSPQQRLENYKDSIDYFLKYGKSLEQKFPDSAMFYYKKAKSLALQNKDKKSFGLFISYAIRILNNNGKYEKALDYSQQLISIGQELKDTVALIKGYNDAANEYEYLGELQKASEDYMTALNLADRINNKQMQQKLDNNIASVFIELKDYHQANKYANESYKLVRLTKDSSELGSSLINLGITEIHIDKYNSALEHFNQAIQIGKKVGDATLIADAKLNRGIIFTNQGKLKKAKNDYEDVQSMANKLNMPDYSLYALFSLAGVYQTGHNFSQAVLYTKQAIKIGEKIKAANELQEMYDSLSVFLEKIGDLKGALKYRKMYEALHDSILNAKVKTNINRLQIQYKAAQKDKQIAEQNLLIEKKQSTIKRENTLLLFSVIGIIILLLLIILSYRLYRQRKKLHEQSILNFQKEQEVIRLKATMEGREEERRRISSEMHDDIGSSLTTIMYLSSNLNSKNQNENSTAINKIKYTAETVVDKMNEIIWSMNKDYDTLEDLITYIRFNAVQVLENNNIKYQIIMPEFIPAINLSGEKRRNIYLVAKEAVHNIIKHAEASEVSLDFIVDDELKINICDNGKGFELNNIGKFGNGLKNMKYRMESIGGEFSILQSEKTIAAIKFPLS